MTLQDISWFGPKLPERSGYRELVGDCWTCDPDFHRDVLARVQYLLYGDDPKPSQELYEKSYALTKQICREAA